MDILNIQVIGVVFAIVMLYLTFLFYKKNTYSRSSFIFWVVIWAIAGITLIFPQTITAISHTLAFARTTDFYVAIGLAFVTMITFLNYANVKRQERRIEELVRATAIKNAEKKRK